MLKSRNLNDGYVYGGQGTLESQEASRFRDSGENEMADLFDRTGNMKVAKTLRKYQHGGRHDNNYMKEMFGQDYGSNLIDPTDPTEQTPWNTSGENLSQYHLSNKTNLNWADGTPVGDFPVEKWRKNTAIPEGDPAYLLGDGFLEKNPTVTSSTQVNQQEGQAEPSIYKKRNYENPLALTKKSPVGSELDQESLGSFTPQASRSTPSGKALAIDSKSRGFNTDPLLDASETLLNIAPHFRNIREYDTLPGIPNPELGSSVNLKTPSLEADRQAIIAQGKNAAAQTNDPAIRAQIMAKTQSALSQLSGKDAQIQASVSNREAVFNNQVESRNLSKVNQYYTDKTERELYKMRGKSQERNRIAENMLSSIGGQRQRKLDNQKLGLEMIKYQSEGTNKRAFEKVLANPENYSREIVEFARLMMKN